MAYDYSKLSGKITEKFKTQAAFANALGITERTLSHKMNCKKFWKQNEMFLACDLLDIPVNEISTYFFTAKV